MSALAADTTALVAAALELRRAQRRHAPSGDIIALYTTFEREADVVLDEEANAAKLEALEALLAADGRRNEETP